MLACALFAGVRAGSFAFDPCHRFGNVEGHQAMLTDDAGGQLGSKEKNLLKLKTAMMLRPELDSPAIGQIEYPAFKSDPDRSFAPIEFWADHAEFGPFDVEAIADANLYRSKFIAHCHRSATQYQSNVVQQHPSIADDQNGVERQNGNDFIAEFHGSTLSQADILSPWKNALIRTSRSVLSPRSGISESRELVNGGLPKIQV